MRTDTPSYTYMPGSNMSSQSHAPARLLPRLCVPHSCGAIPGVILGVLLVCMSLVLVPISAHAQPFQLLNDTDSDGITNPLNGVYFSSSAWGDYDGDGDLDLVLAGRDPGLNRTATIYRNDGPSGFTDIGAGLTGISSGSIAWGDYDNDGDLDLVVTGQDPDYNLTATIYRNDGPSGFTDIGAGLTGVSSGLSSWAWDDYDGDRDLVLTGSGRDLGLNLTATIYRNDGPSGFTDIGAGLTGIAKGSSAWGDYDNDGDLDLIVTGRDGRSAANATIYRNDGPSGFTDIGAGLTGLPGGSSGWGDYDGDGDLDLVVTGGNMTTIYRNDGPGGFTDIGAGLTGVYISSSAWGDYDNDGDLDLVITGGNADSNPTAMIYENQRPPRGQRTFASIGAELTGVDSGASAWGDYDNDGDFDLAVAGDDGSTRTTTIYENQGDGTFASLTSASLTGVNDGSIAWGDYDNDGDLDLVVTGDDTAGSSPTATIYENQGGGMFAPLTNANLTGVSSGSSAWGDYDNDGDLDLVVTGFDGNARTATIYENQGQGTFAPLTGATLTGVAFGSSAWGDYDSDGDLDLVVTGETTGLSPTATIYENQGGNTFAPLTGAGLAGVSLGSSSAWGDYDADGDLDLVLTGRDPGFDRTATIYRNDGPSGFTGINAGLTGVSSGSSAWGDYDSDGDLDLIVTGDDGDVPTATVYENQGGDTFEILTNSGLAGVGLGSSSAWGDFDADGAPDLVLTGRDASGSPTATVYENVDFVPTVTLTSSGSSYMPPTPQPGTADNPVGRLELTANDTGAALTRLTATLSGSAARGVEELALWQSTSGTFDAATAIPLPDAQTLDPSSSPPGTVTFSGLNVSVSAGGTFIFLVADLASSASGTLGPALAGGGDLAFTGATLSNPAGDFPLPLSGSAPLPVELTAFNAQRSGPEAVTVRWQTLSETGNAGFEVQRRTEGAWQRIGIRGGAGTTDTPQSYRFEDTDLPYAADSLSYRLRQIDTDGTESFSEVVTIGRPVQTAELLPTYPNPVRGRATVRFAVPGRQDVRIVLYDLLGRRVKTVANTNTEGRTEAQLDVSDLASGTYFLRMQTTGHTDTQRVTVVR